MGRAGIARCPAAADAPLPFEAMAIDGKTLRCGVKCGADDAHLLSAFSQRLGVVLGQVAAPDKTNDAAQRAPAAIDDLLARLVLTGWVVTMDALFMQTQTARTICDASGDYLMAVKGNQPTPHGDLTLLFADPDAACLHAEERRMHGGRIERRHARAGADAVARALGDREQAPLDSRVPLGRVTFDEDRSTVRAGDIPQVMAALRSTAISVARLPGATNIAAACRRYAAQSDLALAAIGLSLDFE